MKNWQKYEPDYRIGDAESLVLCCSFSVRGGKAIEPFTAGNCSPFADDKTMARVEWNGADDLSALRGKPVRFRFRLTNGKLYAFWVSPDRSGDSRVYRKV